MPKGNPNFGKKTEEIKQDEQSKVSLNIDEIVAKAVAEALEKQKSELMTQVVEPKKSQKSNFNFIPEHSRVRVHSNVDGKFIINDTRGQSFFVELNGYKDSTTLSFKELKNFYGKNYTFFTSGKLAIIDVNSDIEITLEDVIKDLNLTKIYYDKNKVSPIEIEQLFYDDMDITEFENKVRNSIEVAETIVEVGYILYKQGIFKDNSKMNFLRQLFRDSNLFTK